MLIFIMEYVKNVSCEINSQLMNYAPNSRHQHAQDLILRENNQEVVNVNEPNQAWAQAFAAAPVRLNIDGYPIEDNNRLRACDNTGQMMVNSSPDVQAQAWFIPGGVISAAKLFTGCSTACRGRHR